MLRRKPTLELFTVEKTCFCNEIHQKLGLIYKCLKNSKEHSIIEISELKLVRYLIYDFLLYYKSLCRGQFSLISSSALRQMSQPNDELSQYGSTSLSSNVICCVVKVHLISSTNTVLSSFSVVSSRDGVSQSTPCNKTSSYEWII